MIGEPPLKTPYDQLRLNIVLVVISEFLTSNVGASGTVAATTRYASEYTDSPIELTAVHKKLNDLPASEPFVASCL